MTRGMQHHLSIYINIEEYAHKLMPYRYEYMPDTNRIIQEFFDAKVQTWFEQRMH
jgi:hypothetical protein